MKKSKGVLSFFLALTIIISSISVGFTAFAEDESTKNEAITYGSNNIATTAYDGLDENYQTIADALMIDYVNDTKNYELGDRTVVAYDNDDGDIAKAVLAFYNIIASRSSYSNGTTHFEVAKNVASTIKSAMGSDWNEDSMYYTITRLLNGCGTAENGNKENKHNTVTVYSTDKTNLLKYSSVSELPDEVTNSIQTDYYVTSSYTVSGRKFKLSSYSKNEEYSTDSQTPLAIKAYYNMFCTGVINTNCEDLDEETYNSLAENGRAVVDAVSSLDEEIITHFFGDVTIATANQYLVKVMRYAMSSFLDDLSDIAELVESKTEKDFTTAELEELRAQLDSLEAIYENFSDEQKKAIGDDYNSITQAEALYTSAYNYNVSLEYADAVAKISKYADSNYKFQKDEVDEIKSLLENAQSVYEKFIGDVDDAQVKANAQIYNTALANFNEALVDFQWEDFDVIINKLADQFDIDYVTQISTTNVSDNENGDILTTAKLNFEAVSLLNEIDSSAYNSSTAVADKIKEELKEILGSRLYASKNVDTVITMLCGGELKQDNKNASFIVTPDYMAQYSKVSELPESIDYSVEIFEYNHSDDNTFTSIKQASSNYSDTVAYTVFNYYEEIFTDEVVNGDLKNLTIEELDTLIVNANTAVEGISVYSDETVERLLGNAYEKAESVIAKCSYLITTLYCDAVESLYNDYGNRELTIDDKESFYEKCAEIDSIYDAIPDDLYDNEAVVAARIVYLELCSSMEAFLKDYYFNNFISICKENLDSRYTVDSENNITINDFDSFEITRINNAIKKVNSAYELLDSNSKTNEQVTFYLDIVARLQNAIDELTKTPSFSQYNVEYPSDVSTEQVDNVIQILEALLGSDMVEQLFDGQSLEEYFNGTVDDLLTGESADLLLQKVIMTVYPMLQDGLDSTNAITGTALEDIRGNILSGLYPDPDDFPNRKLIKSNYPEVGAKIAEAGTDWDAVDWANITWNIQTREEFCDALGAALAGAAIIVRALLQGTTASLTVVGISFGSATKVCDGNQGYRKDILPLLELLGCENLTSPDDFEKNSFDLPDMFKAILIPLLDRVDSILAGDTVGEVLDLLPNLGYIVTYDLLTSGINDVLSPLSSFGLSLEGLLGTENIDSKFIMSTINGLLEEQGITLPDINWAELSGIGEWQTLSSLRDGGQRNYIKANREDVLVYITYYLSQVVVENEKPIKALVGNNSLANTIISQVASKCAQDEKVVASALFNLLTPYTTLDSDFTTQWTKTTVSYNNGYTASDVEKLVETLTGILDTAIPMLIDGSLNELINNNLYTGDIANTLFTTIYNALDSDDINTVLSLISVTHSDGTVTNIDVSKEAVIKNLNKYGFKKVASKIKKLGDDESLASAVISSTDWNIDSSEDFVNALLAILAPFDDVLAVLLAGSDMTLDVAGVLTVNGANGYNNAVKPLLDALKCDAMTSADYNNAVRSDSSNALANIINPILNLVSQVADDPINSVIDILPSVALFMDNGGIQSSVEQLLSPLNNVFYAVTRFIDTDDIYEWLMSDVLNEFAGISLDWSNLQNEIVPLLNNKLFNNIKIGSATVSLKLPDIEWSTLAGCVKKSSGSLRTIKADTTVELLRYVWSAVQTNKNAINKIVKALAGDNTYKTISPYLNNLYKLDADEVIKILTSLVKGLDASSYTVDWSFLYKNYKSASVSYPSSVSSKDINEVIDILSTALTNLLSSVLEISLADITSDAIYTDETITTIASKVYSLLDDSTVATVFGVLGTDVSKDAIANSLKANYRSVYKSISKAKSLSTADTSKWKWNVNDKKSFAKALTAVLSPFEDVLAVFLNSGTIDIAGMVNFTGANGYANAIKPMLDALGCTTVSASKYASDAKKNKDNLLLNIINPVLNLVDEVLADPINGALDILPSIANFIDKGGVQTAVEALVYPVTNLVDPLLVVIFGDKDTSIFDLVLDLVGVDAKWSKLQNEIIPILNDKVLKDVGITLPAIKWSKLASCGKLKNNSISGDGAKELMTILNYAFDVLKNNKSTILELVGGKKSTLGTIVNNVINCGADGLVKIVVNILLKLETVENRDWIFKSIATIGTSYTANYGVEEFTQALSMTDETILSMLSDLAGISLTSLLSDNLYTNSLVNTVAKAVYQNLEGLDIGIDLNTVLGLLDVDITTSGVASQISDYKSASKTISKYKKWADVDFDSIDWGVEKGNRTDFVNALAAVLRPLSPVLRAVLSGDELVVLGSIEIKGGNGYNTAIVPIAEALSIDSSSLVSVAKYTKQADSDALITNILNPLLDKVEELAEAPVATLCDALPNLAYFVYNGGLKSAVENLIAPVTNILNEIDPIYSVNLDLSALDNLDIDSLVNSLLSSVEIKGTPLGIQITDIDLATLAGRGTIESYTSVRTYDSKNMICKRVNADSTAVYISVLRYLLNNIQTNLSAIETLLGSLNLDSSVMDIINQVLSMLATEDVDSVLEMLLELLFGFGSSEDATLDSVESTLTSFDPFNLGNYYWVYWLIFAVVTIAVVASLFLIFKKKKENEEEPETDVTQM